MEIAEIIEKLRQEQSFGSRFPVRMIFAESLQAYIAIESQLKGACDVTVNLADFCKAPDIVPRFNRLNEELSSYTDKQVLVLSIGEYLRLCIKRAGQPARRVQGFLGAAAVRGVPEKVCCSRFCCRDIFDRVVGVIDERQQDFVWTLEYPSEAESHTISVYSPKFRESIKADADNLSTWLRNWSTILSKKCRVP